MCASKFKYYETSKPLKLTIADQQHVWALAKLLAQLNHFDIQLQLPNNQTCIDQLKRIDNISSHLSTMSVYPRFTVQLQSILDKLRDTLGSATTNNRNTTNTQPLEDLFNDISAEEMYVNNVTL